jgi:hypothetical protein
MQFNIDIFVFQEAIEVRDLRHHANRARIANGALTILFATQAII